MIRQALPLVGGFVKYLFWEIKELPGAFKRGWEQEMNYREQRNDNYYNRD